MSEAVTVQLPAILAQITGGSRHFEVQGQTLRQALDDLIAQQPALGYHLFDEAGKMRRHILCFCNDEYHRGRDGLQALLKEGDKITILNSVSGGNLALGDGP